MTKKQCGIIFTLLTLILCVGMLAAKLNNGGLNDPTDLSQVLSSENIQNVENSEDAEALNQTNYFYESRSLREQQDSSTIQSLKAIISDENTSQENKDDATKKLTKKTMVRENEGRIELGIKNKGYEDALCMLEDSKATVITRLACFVITKLRRPNCMEDFNKNENIGVVKISDEVVSVIAGIAAQEIEGVIDAQNGVAGNITNIFKGKKGTAKATKVTLVEDKAIIDMNVAVEYGKKIMDLVSQVQDTYLGGLHE